MPGGGVSRAMANVNDRTTRLRVARDWLVSGTAFATAVLTVVAGTPVSSATISTILKRYILPTALPPSRNWVACLLSAQSGHGDDRASAAHRMRSGNFAAATWNPTGALAGTVNAAGFVPAAVGVDMVIWPRVRVRCTTGG